MSNGGRRRGAGRKKIGIVVNTRIEEELLNEIDKKIDGKSRAERIRNCLKKGLNSEDGKG